MDQKDHKVMASDVIAQAIRLGNALGMDGAAVVQGEPFARTLRMLIETGNVVDDVTPLEQLQEQAQPITDPFLQEIQDRFPHIRVMQFGSYDDEPTDVGDSLCADCEDTLCEEHPDYEPLGIGAMTESHGHSGLPPFPIEGVPIRKGPVELMGAVQDRIAAAAANLTQAQDDILAAELAEDMGEPYESRGIDAWAARNGLLDVFGVWVTLFGGFADWGPEFTLLARDKLVKELATLLQA